MNCKLCNINKADQTGSHIISAFMLAAQIGQRGNESSYLINSDPSHNYKENRKDSDIKEDYILCRDCEKKLSFIENIYSAEITNKIEVERFEQNFNRVQNEGSYYLECAKVNPIVFYLMIYSVIWRASISQQPIYEHFNLTDNEEEELRFILDLFLPTTIDHEIKISQKQWEKMVGECQILFSFFPFFLVKAENIAEKTGTFQYFDNVSRKPYHIMVGEFIILTFLHKIDYLDNFFDIKIYIENFNTINKQYKYGRITVLENEVYESIIGKINDLTAEQVVKELNVFYTQKLISEGIIPTNDKVRSLVQNHLKKL